MFAKCSRIDDLSFAKPGALEFSLAPLHLGPSTLPFPCPPPHSAFGHPPGVPHSFCLLVAVQPDPFCIVGLTFSIAALLAACCPLPACRRPMTADRRPLPSESRLAALSSRLYLPPAICFLFSDPSALGSLSRRDALGGGLQVLRESGPGSERGRSSPPSREHFPEPGPRTSEPARGWFSYQPVMGDPAVSSVSRQIPPFDVNASLGWSVPSLPGVPLPVGLLPRPIVVLLCGGVAAGRA